MSGDLPDGHLEAARAAGAHDEFLAFVAEYPDSAAAGTLRTAISMDALDDFGAFAGSFVGALWRDGAPHASNPDIKNGERIRELFERDRWPAWMREQFDEPPGYPGPSDHEYHAR